MLPPNHLCIIIFITAFYGTALSLDKKEEKNKKKDCQNLADAQR